jgi:hypothetical protein
LAVLVTTGRVKETLKTDCKIASSATISPDDTLYVATWQSGASTECSVYSLGKYTQASATGTTATGTANGNSNAITHGDSADTDSAVDSNTWTCRAAPALVTGASVAAPTTGTGTETVPAVSAASLVNSDGSVAAGNVEAYCSAVQQRKRSPNLKPCVPGLIDYVGRGVDISYDITDLDFWKARVSTFNTLNINNDPITLNEGAYIGPSSDELDVTADDTLLATDPALSGYFTSVTDFSYQRAANQLKLFDPSSPVFVDNMRVIPKVPATTAFTAIINATGVQSDDISEVSEAASANKYVLANTASKALAKLKLKPSVAQAAGSTTKEGVYCGQSFLDKAEALTETYNPVLYRAFIEEFGTHVAVSGTLGGHILAVTSISSCDLASSGDFNTVEAAYAAFTAQVGRFIMSSDDPAMDFMGITMDRSDLEVCGGDEAVVYNTQAGIWSAWTATLLPPVSTTSARIGPKKSCMFSPDLVPIWEFIPSRGPHSNVRAHLAVSVVRYLQDAIKLAVKEEELNLRAHVHECASNSKGSAGGKSKKGK